MTAFSITTDIQASPDRVFGVMSDTDRWHEWTPSVTSIKRLDDGPFAVGTRLVIRQPKFPPALWKLTAIEPGRSFTWVSTAPGIRVTAHHSVEPKGPNSSRVVLSLRYEGLFAGLLARLTRAITERYLGYEAKGLKSRSENPAFRHAG